MIFRSKRSSWRQLAQAVALGLILSSYYSPRPVRAQQTQAVKGRTAKAESAAGQSTNESITIPKRDPYLQIKRKAWFDQRRAYPFDHIPSGAYWRAQREKEALIAKPASLEPAPSASNPARVPV
jgi:hypothetical protein